MAKSGVRIEGLNKVVRALIEMGLEVDDLKDAFAKISQEAASKAAEAAPRRTGRLAGDVRGNRAKSKAVVTAGRASVPYAGPINYGWPARGIEPARFMQKADEQMQPVALRLLEDDINAKLREKGLL